MTNAHQTGHQATDSPRSARGNAVLIQLATQTFLEPALNSHGNAHFLLTAVEQIRALRHDPAGPAEQPPLTLDPTAYQQLATVLDTAAAQANIALTATDNPEHAAHLRHILRTLTKCSARALRIAGLTSAPKAPEATTPPPP